MNRRILSAVVVAAAVAAAPRARADDVHDYFERQRRMADGYVAPAVPAAPAQPKRPQAIAGGGGGKVEVDCAAGRTSFRPMSLPISREPPLEVNCSPYDWHFEHFLKELARQGGA